MEFMEVAVNASFLVPEERVGLSGESLNFGSVRSQCPCLYSRA